MYILQWLHMKSVMKIGNSYECGVFFKPLSSPGFCDTDSMQSLGFCPYTERGFGDEVTTKACSSHC